MEDMLKISLIMKKALNIVILLFIINNSYAQQFTDLYGDYLGQVKPIDTPFV